MTSTHNALFTKAESELLAQTTAAALAPLGHADLAKLENLVRKHADKYRDLYRRQGSATVAKTHSRARTATANASTAEKAELFSAALSRVTAQLAKRDREEASDLRNERLAAARAAKSGGPNKVGSTSAGKAAGASTSRAKKTGPSGKAAATRSANARSQAKRDGK